MSFSILNIASRALAAQQLSLDVTGNNLSNATTPGYHSQTANLSEVPPSPSPLEPNLQLGQGVTVSSVTRASNAFLSRSVRNQLSLNGYWTQIKNALQPIQSIFNEPSSSGLSESLNQFFGAWQTLSQSPNSLADRQNVISQGKNLAATFNAMGNAIVKEQAAMTTTVTSTVSQINSLSQQIAHLNVAISQTTGAGNTANTLLDQRGRLLDQLSQLTNISYTQTGAQQLNVYIGTHPLVVTNQAYPIALSTSATPVPIWQDTQTPVGSQSGSLAAAIAVRSSGQQYLSGYLSELNHLASTVVSAVNHTQTTGYQYNSSSLGPNFFNPAHTTAATMSVSSTLTPTQIAAASSPNSPGNGSNALAQYDSSLTAQSGLNATFAGYFTNLVGQVGNDGQYAVNQAASTSTTLNSLKNSRQSATGVDVNQASANLLQEEQSYMAAAKIVMTEQSVMNSLLQAVN